MRRPYPSALGRDASGAPVVRGSSLTKVRQWETWFKHWLAERPPENGFDRLLVDTFWSLLHLQLTMARRLRGGAPVWDRGGGTEEDWMHLVDPAMALLAKWQRNKPRNLQNLRVEIRQLADIMDGMLANTVRLAREIDTMKATEGCLAVNVNPYSSPADTPEQ